MDEKIEYQIFIGCHDQYFNNEYVTSKELKELIVEFFASREVDFSLFYAQGGYLYEDGNFQIENSVCVNIIGADEGEIIQLAKNLSMYMSQESSLIIKNPLKIELL
jgi:hypothetical protein